MNLTSLTFGALRKEISRTSANIAKRAARIEAAGTTNSQLEHAKELRALPAPTTRNEALSRAAELRRLDQSQGTRARGAEQVAQRDRARSDRQFTEDFLTTSPRAVPPRELLDDYVASLRKSLEGKTSRVKRVFQSTPATDAFDEWKADQEKGQTTRSKAAQARRLIQISKYQGIDVKGAQKQHERGQKAFGGDYDTWTKEQQAAAWEGFRELSERSSSTMGSDLVLAELQAAAAEGSLQTAFYNQTVSDGAGGTRTVLRASVSVHLDEAKLEAAHKEFSARKLAEALARSKPWKF